MDVDLPATLSLKDARYVFYIAERTLLKEIAEGHLIVAQGQIINVHDYIRQRRV